MKKLESRWGDPADTQRVSDQEEYPSAQVRIHGVHKSSLETGRRRLLLGAGLFTVGFFVLSLRLVEVALFNEVRTPVAVNEAAEFNDGPARADIVDRNGVVLATNLNTHSLYADPQDVRDSSDAANRLIDVLHGIDLEEVDMSVDNYDLLKPLSKTEHAKIFRPFSFRGKEHSILLTELKNTESVDDTQSLTTLIAK